MTCQVKGVSHVKQKGRCIFTSYTWNIMCSDVLRQNAVNLFFARWRHIFNKTNDTLTEQPSYNYHTRYERPGKGFSVRVSEESVGSRDKDMCFQA